MIYLPQVSRGKVNCESLTIIFTRQHDRTSQMLDTSEVRITIISEWILIRSLLVTCIFHSFRPLESIAMFQTPGPAQTI